MGQGVCGMDSKDEDAVFRDVLGRVKVIAVVGWSPKPERASHGVAAFLKRKGYRVIPVNPGQAGQEALGSYESSPGKLRHFCTRCGSQLVAERAGQPHVIVRVATLDDDPGVSPQQHIWCSHDRPWLASDAQPHHAAWQPGRE